MILGRPSINKVIRTWVIQTINFALSQSPLEFVGFAQDRGVKTLVYLYQ
jgi:hypothetical protein